MSIALESGWRVLVTSERSTVLAGVGGVHFSGRASSRRFLSLVLVMSSLRGVRAGFLNISLSVANSSLRRRDYALFPSVINGGVEGIPLPEGVGKRDMVV